MVCRVHRVNGSVAIVCGPKPRQKRCAHPGCISAAEKQCDHPTLDGGTCDVFVCTKHCRHTGEDRDICWQHPKEAT